MRIDRSWNGRRTVVSYDKMRSVIKQSTQENPGVKRKTMLEKPNTIAIHSNFQIFYGDVCKQLGNSLPKMNVAK